MSQEEQPSEVAQGGSQDIAAESAPVTEAPAAVETLPPVDAVKEPVQQELPDEEALKAAEAEKEAAELKALQTEHLEEILGDVVLFENFISDDESETLAAQIIGIGIGKTPETTVADLHVLGKNGPFVKQGVEHHPTKKVGCFREKPYSRHSRLRQT